MTRTFILTIAIAATVIMSSFTDKDVNGTFKASPNQSTVKWLGKKVTGEHYGKINVQDAALDIKNGKLTGGKFTIDMNSITCDDLEDEGYNKKLVGHLKSDDFFGVEKFPTASFVITEVKSTGSDAYNVKGDLTIKGITKQIEFPATVKIDGNTSTAIAKVVIDRSDFDVRYGSESFFDGLGDKMIYDDFELDINLVAAL